MKRIVFLLIASLCATSVLFAESRTWTSSDGSKTLEGELVKSTDKLVTLKLDNGKTVTMKPELLSEADREFIKEAKESAKEEKDDKADSDKAKEAKKPAMTTFKWGKSYKKALEEAKEYDLPVVVLFTGTSWCGYCIKLEDEVFSKAEFKKLAAGKFIGVKFEAPSSAGPKSKEGKDLAAQFAVRGYPCVIIVDKNGEKKGQTGYNQGISPESFVKTVVTTAGK